MKYRYVFKNDSIDAVVYSNLEPYVVIKSISQAHDDGHGWSFEYQLYLGADALKNTCMFVAQVEDEEEDF